MFSATCGARVSAGSRWMTRTAHHAIAGSDFDQALLYARRAGDRALELLADQRT